ncbi:putative tRNA methyltransferase 9B [Rhinophrynus dorsalis]
MEKEAHRLEREHVHSVYEKIAPYFNDKRYKAWPKVQEFLLAQEPGSLIADIGCGNGKYLHINNQAFKVGCDYCIPLAKAARSQGYEVLVCDGLQLPYRTGCFDAVLSIAVIHHFSTKERRIRAIQEMARILKVGGRIMIYVWALEQKRRKFEKQDILVPWQWQPISPKASSGKVKKTRNSNFRSLNKYSGSMDNSTEMQQGAKSSSLVGDKSCENVPRLRVLSRSLDSGLECTDDDQKYEGVLRRFFDYCIQINNSASGHTFQKSHPKSFLNRIGDILPKYMHNFDSNTIKVTEAPTFPLLSNCSKCSSNTELLTSTEVIKDYSNVPLPDMVPSCNRQPNNHVLNQDLFLYPPAPCGDGSNRDESEKKEDSAGEMSSEKPLLPPGEKSECLRYYHIFKQGELTELIEEFIPELHVVQTYFDHCNWCVVAEKIQLWKI